METRDQIPETVRANRKFEPLEKLDYGDAHLDPIVDRIASAIRKGDRIALYADYDVDGTMSCVSWVWFLKAIGYTNFTTYIPCRFQEGYGVNKKAVVHLIEDEKAQMIITMDTGITANEEAALCKSRGVEFICTDHHQIQPDRMPDCWILNPKLHPDPRYQELCGCGITFVVLRKLSRAFPVPNELWTDLLALAGMATICDVVPLNAVNHKLARQGLDALVRSRRPVLTALLQAANTRAGASETEVAFRVGPRINAVGRLGHAETVVRAFLEEEPHELVAHMGECNERRKEIQQTIVAEAFAEARLQGDAPIFFLGGDWHPGVVGIAASKVAETFWRPVWLFDRKEMCKGSARSIPGFDVTAAMASVAPLWKKFGGHRAAGGFSFDPAREGEIREGLLAYAENLRRQTPQLWESAIHFDGALPLAWCDLESADRVSACKPFGMGFEEPVFQIAGEVERVDYLKDKQTLERKHTTVWLREGATRRKVMFFSQVLDSVTAGQRIDCLVALARNSFRGTESVLLRGIDFAAQT